MIFTGERLDQKDIGGINEFRYKQAAKYVKGKKVLELGCAFGYGTNLLAKGAKEITAVDSDKNAIELAVQKYNRSNITYIRSEIEKLHLDKKYDIVIAFEIIEHLSSPEILLKFAKSHLNSKGSLILSTPNRYQSSYDGDKPSNPFHVKEYFPHELDELLNKYFSKVKTCGVLTKGKKYDEEKQVQQSLMWKLASTIVKKRNVRRIVNYIPSGPKRLITGESKLQFDSSDFTLVTKDINNAPYLFSICKK